MTYYLDTASVGGALGNTETGGAAWTVGSGTGWAKSGGKFKPDTGTPGNDYIYITSPHRDVDMSANLRESNDALYMRIVDANNWIRVRTQSQGYRWADSPYTKELEVLVVLEQRVAGVITQLAVAPIVYTWTWAGGFGQHAEITLAPVRVVIRGTTLKVYYGNNTNPSINTFISTHQTATKFGIGRAPSTALLGGWASILYDADRGPHLRVYNDAALDDFTLTSLEPIVPILASPLQDQTAQTAKPVLISDVNHAYGFTQKVQYQVASNSAFTTSVQTITEPDEALRTTGQYSVQVPTALPQGTWYLRLRSVNEFGDTSPWVATTTFVVSHPPGTINHSPSNGQGVLTVTPTQFSWSFSDPYISDSQSAYQMVIERNDTGALVYDTGKVVSSGFPAPYAISNTLLNIELRWKVRVWDQDDVAGSYSNYQVIRPLDRPTVVITAPVTTVVTGNPLIDWTYTAGSGGYPQAQYRVSIYNDTTDVLVYDTGFVLSSESQHQTTGNRVRNNNDYTVTVEVLDSINFAAIPDDSTFDVSYTTPDAPSILANELPFSDFGYVETTWTNAVVDINFVSWQLYRREAGAGEDGWEKIYQTSNSSSNEFFDYLAPADRTLDYTVTQSVLSFGEIVESERVSYDTVSTGIIGYWLIDLVNSDNNVQLKNVNTESFKTNRERAELVVVGRGRHVDIGQDMGKSGTLSAQLRDSAIGTAREQRERLEALASTGDAVHLRNPFGDVLLISLGDLDFSRIAGVGPHEFVDVTFTYSVVA